MTALNPAGTRRGSAAPDVPLGALGLSRPLVVSSDATIQTAAQAMLRAGRSAVVVGSWTVVTEHDIARAVALGRPPTTPAAAIAGHEGLVLRSTTTVLDAVASMLREHARDVVVLGDDLEITGTVDLASALEIVLGERDVPTWLSALRISLHGELRLE